MKSGHLVLGGGPPCCCRRWGYGVQQERYSSSARPKPLCTSSVASSATICYSKGRNAAGVRDVVDALMERLGDTGSTTVGVDIDPVDMM